MIGVKIMESAAMGMEYRDALRLTIAYFDITQTDLAQKAGVKYQAISDFKKGRKDLRVSTLTAIINALPSEARDYFYRLVEGKSPESLAARASTPPLES